MVGVGILTFVAGAMIAQLTAGMATRDALFLSLFSPTALPYVMASSAVVSLAVVSLFAKLLVRFAPDRVVPAAFMANAVLFVADCAMGFASPRASAVMTYLHTMALGGVLVSGFWSLMSERFDPHTAKRVFGRIGAGASIGGVIGGLGAWRAGAALSISTMMLMLAAVNVVCALALLRARKHAGALAPSAAPTPAVKGLSVPYLRHMAALVVIAAIADVSIDYAFKATTAGAYARENLIEFFALFYTVAGLVSFVLQAVVTRTMLRGVGLTGTLACQPIALAIGSVIAIVIPGMWPVTIARGTDGAMRTSLFKAGYELLYTPLSPVQKRASKTVIDVGFGRLGGFAGSVLVLVAITVSPTNAVSLLLGLAAFGAVLSLVVVGFLHRGYVSALADSLLRGAIHLEPDDTEDRTTRRTLALTTMGIDHAQLREQMNALRVQLGVADRPEHGDLLTRGAALRSPDVERVRKELATELEPALVGLVLPLLARDELVEDVTQAVRKIAPRVTGQLVDALIDPVAPPLVRRRIPRILVASVTQRSVDGLLLGIAADSYDIRHRSALALERLVELDSALRVDPEAVMRAVGIELRRLGGAHDRERLAQIFLLLGLVLDRRPLKLAHLALASTDGALRGTGLEYLENVVPANILESLLPHLGGRPRPADRRAREQIVDELVRSVTGIELDRNELDDEPRERLSVP